MSNMATGYSSSMERATWISLLGLTFLGRTSGVCLFDRYHGAVLEGNVSRAESTRSSAQCQRLCLRLTECSAANVRVTAGRTVVCEILTAVQPATLTMSDLSPDPSGMLLVPRPTVPLTSLAGVTCDQSSAHQPAKDCRRVYDGSDTAGSGEWVTAGAERDGAWVSVHLPTPARLTTVNVLFRCLNNNQFTSLTFSFSDGSVQQFTRTCTGVTTSYTECAGQLKEEFDVADVDTTSVTLTAKDMCESTGGVGLRELELFGVTG